MNKKNIFCASLIFLFSSCKEVEEVTCDTDTCPIGLEQSTITAIEITDSSIFKCLTECVLSCELNYPPEIPYNYLYPCFNPNDDHQLAYYRKDNFNSTSVGYELWVRNFCTGEQNMITDKAYYGIDWSTKDWLIYTATDQMIWKIKSNGDSLTQLTSEGSSNRYPRWSPNGSKIAYEPEIQGGTFFYIMDEFGNNIEAIDELAYSGRWCWVNNNEICYTNAASSGIPNSNDLNIYNINTEEIHLLHTIHQVNSTTGTLDSLIRDIEKLPNENSIVWSALGVIGKTDLTSGSFQILQDKLFHERFYSLTVRPNSPEILINKGADYYAGDCYYYTDFGFFLINKNDGSNLQRVILE